MRAPEQFSITLSPDLAELVHREVESGAYRSASEVIAAGLRALQLYGQAVEGWMNRDCELPCGALSPGNARSRLAEARRANRTEA